MRFAILHNEPVGFLAKKTVRQKRNQKNIEKLVIQKKNSKVYLNRSLGISFRPLSLRGSSRLRAFCVGILQYYHWYFVPPRCLPPRVLFTHAFAQYGRKECLVSWRETGEYRSSHLYHEYRVCLKPRLFLSVAAPFTASGRQEPG